MVNTPEHLFVYGTLRSDRTPQRALMAAHFTLLGKAVVQGQLFEIAGYPGMLLSSEASDRVVGELYELTGSTAVWSSLDEYEGCSAEYPQPHEYVRSEVQVLLLAERRWLRAWTWLYNWPVSAQRRILSGDYNMLNEPAAESAAAHNPDRDEPNQ